MALQPRYQFQAFPFHLVESSPWPILTANATLSMMIGAVLYFNGIAHGSTLLTLGFLSTLFAFILWFRDVTTEGTYLGDHTLIVQKGLTMGVSLFIVTEVFFFISIFWAYFHSSLAPTVELGSQWPPVGVTALNPMTVPLLNTVLLLSSGATVTYAHHALIQGNRRATIIGVALTIILAAAFTALQGFEYMEADFTIADGVYGSCFFFSTGFHGFHVIIGTLFIAVAFFRIINYHFTAEHHLGLESSILYWHFVDVVWLFLYAAVYWWGSDGVFATMLFLSGRFVKTEKTPQVLSTILTFSFTLLVYLGKLILFSELYVLCQNEVEHDDDSNNAKNTTKDSDFSNRQRARSVTPEQIVGGVTGAVLGVVTNPVAGVVGRRKNIFFSSVAQDFASNLHSDIVNASNIMEVIVDRAENSFTPGSPGTGLHEVGEKHLFDNANHDVESFKLSNSVTPKKLEKSSFIGSELIETLINSITKQLPENTSNNSGEIINMPNTLNKMELFNKSVKVMYLCLVGAISNLYIIALVYFVPLIFKRMERFLPSKAVSMVNWVLRYRYVTYYFFGFLALNNLLTIASLIITMLNNPL